jgi:hypothetical protein
MRDSFSGRKWYNRASASSYSKGTGPFKKNGCASNVAPPIAISSFLLAGNPLLTIDCTGLELLKSNILDW